MATAKGAIKNNWRWNSWNPTESDPNRQNERLAVFEMAMRGKLSSRPIFRRSYSLGAAVREVLRVPPLIHSMDLHGAKRSRLFELNVITILLAATLH